MSTPVYTFRDARLKSLPLRGLNAVGGALAAAGVLRPRLDCQRIADAARQQAQSQQEVDRNTLEALQRYIDSAEADANLNTFGRLAVRKMLVDALASRFAVQDWQHITPAASQERIEKPWVILGLPRTGTSILSILLGLDPLSRPLRQWEAHYPIPPATLSNATDDPRIALLSKELEQLKKLNPAVATMHPFGSLLAEECTAVFIYALRTIGMETIAFTPSYGRWLDNADMGPAYAIHKQTLQSLQQAQPTGRWVLKSPNHLWSLDALLASYPDARIIWAHRDPAKVLPSLASLNSAMQIQFTRQLVPQQVGEYWGDRAQTVIDRAMAFDQTREPGWCYHVDYQDLMANPSGTIEKIYQHFGEPTNSLHSKRIDTWLQQRPQHADGKHQYDPSDFGWTRASLQERFYSYREHYGLATEA